MCVTPLTLHKFAKIEAWVLECCGYWWVPFTFLALMSRSMSSRNPYAIARLRSSTILETYQFRNFVIEKHEWLRSQMSGALCGPARVVCLRLPVQGVEGAFN